MFYVNVRDVDNYTFYYNMVATVKDAVRQVVNDEILANRPISAGAQSYIDNMQAGGLKGGTGPSQFGVMSAYNTSTGNMEYMLADEMAGITAKVNREIAEEVLERAKIYCPVDTGTLRDSGTIIENEDGSCQVVFQCPYAWYVHEFEWKTHKPPTCAKFLTRAVYEIEKLHGYGWA